MGDRRHGTLWEDRSHPATREERCFRHWLIVQLECQYDWIVCSCPSERRSSTLNIPGEGSTIQRKRSHVTPGRLQTPLLPDLRKQAQQRGCKGGGCAQGTVWYFPRPCPSHGPPVVQSCRSPRSGAAAGIFVSSPGPHFSERRPSYFQLAKQRTQNSNSDGQDRQSPSASVPANADNSRSLSRTSTWNERPLNLACPAFVREVQPNREWL